jgi:TrmH family RNA methyltransferase
MDCGGPRARFVLVEPQTSANVGAAARAIKNLGFSRLDLVAPRCDPADEDARRLAVDAADVLGAARVHPTLDAALAGTGAVLGTSALVGKQRKPHYRLDALAPGLGALAAGGEIAFVFGREDRGLEDGELDRCTHLVRFAHAGVYPSFNLAQSVLLCAYTLRLALEREASETPAEPAASHEEREAMYAHLEDALSAIGFLHEEAAEGMMRRIRRILGRAGLTSGDAKVLRGIARQVLWAAGRAGLREP